MSTAIAEFIEKLTEPEKEALAWQLMDQVGLVVVLAMRASDFVERRDDAGDPPATAEEIRQAILKVSGQDWSLESRTAKGLVDWKIEKLIAARTEA